MTFTNSILAGLTLVREAIESEGFVSGSTGWRIDRHGDAEFNDIDIRGNWTIQGTDADDFITGRVVTGIPRIEFARDGVTYALQALSDAVFGERWSIGSLSGATPNIAFTESPEQWIVFGPDVHPGPCVIFDGDYLYAGFTNGTGYHIYDWQAPAFLNGWGNLGSGWEPVGYKKTPDGRVMFKGSMIGGTRTDGTDLFVLPTGYRPANNVALKVGNLTNGTEEMIRIFPTGIVECWGAAATTNGACALDGLSFTLI